LKNEKGVLPSKSKESPLFLAYFTRHDCSGTKRGVPKRYQLNRPDLVAEAAFQLKACKDAHSQKRLLATRIAATGQFTAEQIAEQIGISRRQFFNWMHALKAGGIASLLQRQHGGGRSRLLLRSHLDRLHWGEFGNISPWRKLMAGNYLTRRWNT
jgi:biotin operon repressor